MHLNFPIVSDDIHISTIIQTSEHWSLILLQFFGPSVEKLPKLSYQQATANKHNIGNGIIMSLNFLIVHSSFRPSSTNIRTKHKIFVYLIRIL